MAYKFFIGADIAKDTLSLVVKQESTVLLQSEIENKKESIEAFFSQIKKDFKAGGKNTLLCFEAAGNYALVLTRCAQRGKATVWAENALRIKRTLGLQRGKSDKMDAQRIADYASLFQQNVRPFVAPRKVILRLRLLSKLRDRLKKTLHLLERPVKDASPYLTQTLHYEVKGYQRASCAALRADLEATEKVILKIIQGDERLSGLYRFITSVPCVGPVLATELLIHTNEFLTYTSVKPFACYCGVAPFENTSGTSLRGKSRVSHIANKQMKQALFLPAMRAIQLKDEIGDYYKRKVKEGKPKMSVLNAVKNKLLKRVFTCVAEERIYNKDYVRTTLIKGEANPI